MNKFLIVFIAIVFMFSFNFCSKEIDKRAFIIEKLDLVEYQKNLLKSGKFSLVKDFIDSADRFEIIKFENSLTDELILEKVKRAIDKSFSDREIDDLYYFVHSSAFEKIYKSNEMFDAIDNEFADINSEIDTFHKKLLNQYEEDKNENKKFPISIDREDGFYECINYQRGMDIKNMKLKEKPAIDKDDIEKVFKVKNFNYLETKYNILIQLTDVGTKKFYHITNKNIGKPIAIVVDKKIVSAPIVNIGIMGGTAQISGDYSLEELDKMIEHLKKK